MPHKMNELSYTLIRRLKRQFVSFSYVWQDADIKDLFLPFYHRYAVHRSAMRKGKSR